MELFPFITSTWTRKPPQDPAPSVTETLPVSGTTSSTALRDMAETMTIFCPKRLSPRRPPRSRRKPVPSVEADSTAWTLTCEQVQLARIYLSKCAWLKLPTYLQAHLLLQNLSQSHQLQNPSQNHQFQYQSQNYQLQNLPQNHQFQHQSQNYHLQNLTQNHQFQHQSQNYQLQNLTQNYQLQDLSQTLSINLLQHQSQPCQQ